MLGMEIRVKVEQYVHEKIKALRVNNKGQYENVSIMRMNAMKYLPNFFKKGQVFINITASSLKSSFFFLILTLRRKNIRLE